MEDWELVRETAEQYIEQLGRGAPHYLRAQAAISAAIGDELSERAWIDIAEAAEILLQTGRRHFE